MIGAFAAATVVGLVQYVRSRDRRLLPVTAMLAFQAAALFGGWGEVWTDAFQLAVCVAGLVLILVLSKPPAPPPRA